jgi:DNA-binding winged helix-turn-helix (wHTH) protein
VAPAHLETSVAPGTSHHFGPFRLDAESRVLTRDGTVVPLAPRTFDLLLAFVTRNGRLLTKDELLRLVWAGDLHVEEASLAFQVSTLRKALGEHGSAWIETVPKHGYRFTATVETAVSGKTTAETPPPGAPAGCRETSCAQAISSGITSNGTGIA